MGMKRKYKKKSREAQKTAESPLKGRFEKNEIAKRSKIKKIFLILQKGDLYYEK
ncbi:MAG: hypothetical protein J1E97_07745 [Muribaculaceae bacterium]|nr:hypothetical protein [Muribaculaceae bacterium]